AGFWTRGYNLLFSSGRRHTRFSRDWSADVCSSDLGTLNICRTIARHAGRSQDVYWPEDADTPLLMNAHELLAHAMAAQVEVVLRSAERRVGKQWCAGGSAGDGENTYLFGGWDGYR